MSLSSLAQPPYRLKKLAQLQLVLPLPQSPTGVRTLGGQAVHVSGIPASKKKMKSTSMNGTISYRLVFMRMHYQHESCKHRKYLSRKFHWLVLHQIPERIPLLAPVVLILDSAIHWINHYPADRCQGNRLRFPLDRDLSSGQRCPLFKRLGPEFLMIFQNGLLCQRLL